MSADEPTASDGYGAEFRPFSLRILLIAALCTALTALWVRSVGLINFLAYLADPIPSFPAMFFLSCALVLSALGRRLSVARSALARRLASWLSFSRGELLVLYAFLAIGGVWSGVGMTRFIFPSLTGLQYWQTDYPSFEGFGEGAPAWLVPQDAEVIRELWEGSDRVPFTKSPGSIPVISQLEHGAESMVAATARVPWDAWGGPVLTIGLLLLCMSASFVCLVCMFRAKWENDERLTFPLVRIPLLMTEASAKGRPAFFSDPVMWIGMGVGIVFNLMHVVSSLHPSMPFVERYYNIGALFTERPWNALAGMSVWFAPDLIGIGYIVPSDVLFTTFVTYGGLMLSRVLAETAGRLVAGFPHERTQGNGAYLAMGAVVFWMSRRHLASVVRDALRDAPATEDSPMRPRTMLLGALLGFAGVCGIVVLAGMPVWLAVLFMGLNWLFALVLARARAEGGAPVVYMWPYEKTRAVISTFLPPSALMPGGSKLPLTIANMMFFLHAGQFGGLMATQLESIRLAGQGGFSRRRIVWAALAAIALGYLVAMWMHLATYYEYGANVLEGGTTQGGYRTWATLTEFSEATRLAVSGHDVMALARERNATLMGAAIALLMTVGRITILRFPLHPVGYVIGLIRGQFCWGPFLFTWAVRSAFLRIGGVRLYNRILPAFIGLALGHYMANGIIVGIAGIWLAETFRGRVQHVRSH